MIRLKWDRNFTEKKGDRSGKSSRAVCQLKIGLESSFTEVSVHVKPIELNIYPENNPSTAARIRDDYLSLILDSCSSTPVKIIKKAINPREVGFGLCPLDGVPAVTNPRYLNKLRNGFRSNHVPIKIKIIKISTQYENTF